MTPILSSNGVSGKPGAVQVLSIPIFTLAFAAILVAPDQAYATHETVESPWQRLEPGRFHAAFQCDNRNEWVTERVSFSDGNDRILSRVEAQGRVWHDDDFALHVHLKVGEYNFATVTPPDARLGLCGWGDGCAGGPTFISPHVWTGARSGRSGAATVTVVGNAVEKESPDERGGRQPGTVGFSGPAVRATWKLCHEGEMREDSRCVPVPKTAELELSQNVFALSPDNKTGSGWVINEGDSGSGFDVDCEEDPSAPWAEPNCPTETVYTSAGFGVTVNSPEEPGTHEARMTVRVSRLAPGTTAVRKETETILVRYTVPEPIEPVRICADCGSARLACSVSASPVTIRPGESVWWSVRSNLGSEQGGHTFSWTGSDNGRDIGTVSGGRTNFSASYPVSQLGVYERGIVVEARGQTCTASAPTIRVINPGNPGTGPGPGDPPVPSYAQGPYGPQYRADLTVATDAENWRDSLTREVPLTGVDLQASCGGSFTFCADELRYDCGNGQRYTSNVRGSRSTVDTKVDVCTYATPGTYEAKLEVYKRQSHAGSPLRLQSSDTATITVNQPAPPSCTFEASKDRIVIPPPNSSTLNWSCQNATACSIDQGVGGVNPVTELTPVSPESTTAYTLSCTGPNGNTEESTTVRVYEFSGGSLREVLPQ